MFFCPSSVPVQPWLLRMKLSMHLSERLAGSNSFLLLSLSRCSLSRSLIVLINNLNGWITLPCEKKNSFRERERLKGKGCLSVHLAKSFRASNKCSLTLEVMEPGLLGKFHECWWLCVCIVSSPHQAPSHSEHLLLFLFLCLSVSSASCSRSLPLFLHSSSSTSNPSFTYVTLRHSSL